jgi:hypothetical protein
MCDPTVLAAASFVSQAGSSIIAAGAQDAQSRAVAKAAVADYRIKARDIGTRQGEEMAAATLQIEGAARATSVAQGATSAAAGEGGVTGNSVTALQNVLEGQLGDYTGSVLRNRDSVVGQLQREKLAARAEAASRIAGAPPSNPLATAVGVGNAGLNFGSTLYSINRGGASVPGAARPALRIRPTPGSH